MAHALELKLGREGFEMVVVEDGEEALRILNQEQFDLIILDLILPRRDGFAVLTELKQKKIKTPVIVLSNLGQEEDQERAKKLGVRDYFVKADTSLANLVSQVSRLLNKL